MDRSFLARNDDSWERLRAVVGALTEEALRLVVHDEWTVAATLAHLAFADRQVHGWIEDWEREGIATAAALRAWDRDAQAHLRGQNGARLAGWLAVDPRRASREVLDATETLDGRIARLSPQLMALILGTSLFGRRRPWVLDRSIHRDEHLDEIERALAAVSS